MLVKKVDTQRYYRLPTKEVVEGMNLTYGERYREGNTWTRSEQSLLDSDI